MKFPKMKVPLFNCGDIIFCRSKEELANFLRSVDAEPIDTAFINGMATTYIHGKNNNRMFVFALFNGKISTLAHEVAHIAFEICDKVGVNVKAGEANETFCYLVSNIMEFALKQLEKPV